LTPGSAARFCAFANPELINTMLINQLAQNILVFIIVVSPSVAQF
jgi:hypothetical protein